MAPNSVTGSFQGIEVSFVYNGPHIVMSVLNTAEEGRRLRVMYQQQPLSGRVNWTSFQLTGQSQVVVVPIEVIQSHKLAFYVDNHKPIATYTEKIVDELKQIQDLQLSGNPAKSTASESETQPHLNTQNGQPVGNENNTENKANDVTIQTPKHEIGKDDTAADDKSEIAAHLSKPKTANPTSDETLDVKRNNATPELAASASLQPQNTDVNSNGNRGHITRQEGVQDEPIPKEKSKVTDIPSQQAQSVDESDPIPKRKNQYIGQYIPSVSTELQFKMKVPSLPKSAFKKQTTFIPPRSTGKSDSNGKKHGFFGQLAGVFGFAFSNKQKEFYLQQNRHLHEKFHANLEKLKSDYNNGYGISLDNWDLESLSEQQTAVLLLNLMVNEVSEWKKAAKKGSTTKGTLAKSLENIEDELKHVLKQTRGIQAPAPTLFPDRTAATDQDLMEIQKECDAYLKRFSEKLAVLEQKHAEKVRIPVFKKFLIEFVRDKLFPNVVEFSSLTTVQPRLNWFLDIIDYELMPIEPGKTKFSPEHHEVKEKRSTDLESDTIIEVVSPGLQTKDGKRVIQNAIVIQAE